MSYSSLAYLDHNVLDLMTKGDPHKVRDFLEDNKCTPVYSTENLKEIVKSKGYEQTFINLLEEIGAVFIEVPLNEDNTPKTEAMLYPNNPNELYEWYLSNHVNNKDDFRFTNVLMKVYGGVSNESFKSIVKSGTNDVKEMIVGVSNDLSEIPEEIHSLVNQLEELAPELPTLLQDQMAQMTTDFDNMDLPPVLKFEEATGISPSILKNIEPPNVIQQIWSLFQQQKGFDKIKLENFFGIVPYDFKEGVDRARTQCEKVNAVYHMLNFIGYYRDSKMKKEKRFIASSSDMSHAGMASFCHYFLCRDKDLVMKAAAAYEYLQVGTMILHYHTKKCSI